MKKFFYIENKIKKGPFSLEKIKSLFLDENTMIWETGTKNWIKVKEIEELEESYSPKTPNFLEKNKIIIIKILKILSIGIALAIFAIAISIFTKYLKNIQPHSPEIFEKSLTEKFSEKITECKNSGFIDYTKTLSQEEQDTIISKLKTTEISGDLENYFCSQNRAWRAYTAQNTHTDTELLWFFSHDEDEIVRQYLASNRALPEEIAQKLTGDVDSVLYALARNPSLSEKILQEIFKKPANLRTQESLAYNRGTSDSFQQYLAQRLSHVKALQELAKNPEISEKTREILKKRDIKEVSKILEK